MPLSRVIVRSAGALFSGSILGAAAEPLGWWWAAPLGVAGLLLSARGAGTRSALLIGAVFGATWTLATASWLAVVAWPAVGLLTLVMAAFTSLLAAALRLAGGWRAWPFWSAIIWIVVEVTWSSWPLGGFPWLRLSWTVVDGPMAGWLAWGGLPGASLVVAAVGGVIAWVASSSARVSWRLVVGVAAATVAGLPVVFVPASLSPSWGHDAERLEVAAVQPGVPGDGDDVAANHEAVTDRLAEATVAMARSAQRPDMVLWPENATAVDPARSPVVRGDIERASRSIDVPILLGGVVDGDTAGTARNQTLMWIDGQPRGAVYTKRNLVPFGEYVPWRAQLERWGIGRLDEVPRDMVSGPRQPPFDVAGATVGALICFDVAFSSTVRDLVSAGAELLVVQTSNASFAGTRQLEQQLAITRARAIESGRAVVIAATTGVSAIIRPDGTVLERSTGPGSQVLRAEVPLIDSPTPATSVSAVVSRGAVAVLTLRIAGGLLLAGGRPGRRGSECGPDRSHQERQRAVVVSQ